jgi:hypothetical protein
MSNGSEGSESREQVDKRKKELAARWQKHAEAHEQRMAEMKSILAASAATAERLRALERRSEDRLRRRNDPEGGAAA